jgi:hypothetical protein
MDPIVQNVEIAEAILEQYVAALAAVNGGGLTQRLDQEAQIGSAEQAYPEIWSSLDRARHAAAATGRDLSYYDAIRGYVGVDSARGVTDRSSKVSALVVGVVPVMGAASVTATGNETGVRAARDAIATFRTAFPELPWNQSAGEVPELRTGQGPAMAIAAIGAVVLVGAVFAYYAGVF